MTTRHMFWLSIVGLVGVALALAYARPDPVQGEEPFRVRPMLTSTDEQIGRYALEMTLQSGYTVLSGTPIIRFARRMTLAEIDAQNIDRIYYRCDPPPLAFVVIQGDFDTSRAFKGGGRAQFISYLLHLDTGAVHVSTRSPDGSHVRDVLNDPTLPYRPTPQPSPIPTAVPTPNRATMAADPVCNGQPAPGILGLPNHGPNPPRP